jgi:hypothetical protein
MFQFTVIDNLNRDLNKFKLYQQLSILFHLQLILENKVLASSSLVMYTTKMPANDKIGYNSYAKLMSPYL